jgi:hypothetical protein
VVYNIDVTAWENAHQDDLWVFDKLILANKLGYECGARGRDVPEPGLYVVRPCVNLMGMGEGACVYFLTECTEHIPVGYFWSEIFKGRHLSVDYHNKKQVLCVQGHREDPLRLGRWSKWEKANDVIPFPKVLEKLKQDYEWINVEMIGDKIIEVHFRRNPDFANHNSPYIIPIWIDSIIKPPEGMKFIDDVAGERIGFYICK